MKYLLDYSCYITLSILSLVFTSNCANSDSVDDEGLNKNQTVNAEPQWTLWNTYYYVSNESDYSSIQTTPIYSSSCDKIADVSITYSDFACIEGTGQLTDGRLINYASTCNCGRPCPTGGTVCWSVLDQNQFPWGKGARSNPLHPLRSLAVDRSIIPLGRTVYIPEWDGVSIPAINDLNGFKHDGCFRADDVGGAIQGRHIDIFSGTSEMRRFLETKIPTQTQMPSYWGDGRCDYLSSLSPPARSSQPLVEPPTTQGLWLGDSCQFDNECASAAENQVRWCHLTSNNQGWGFCTQYCTGYCPDRIGDATTLCIDGQSQGIEGGICVAQSQPENGYCTQLRGLSAQERERYIGQSEATQTTQDVCIPDSGSNTFPTEPPILNDFGLPPADVDQDVLSDPIDYAMTSVDYAFPPLEPDQGLPPSLNQGVCDDPTLLLSDHSDPCSSARENQWRCACSRRYETEISQVCRDRIWVTYDTNPVDCGQCQGTYSSACEPSN